VKIDCFTTLQELGFLRIRESSINTPLMRIRSNLRFGSFATGASDSQAWLCPLCCRKRKSIPALAAPRWAV